MMRAHVSLFDLDWGTNAIQVAWRPEKLPVLHSCHIKDNSFGRAAGTSLRRPRPGRGACLLTRRMSPKVPTSTVASS
jgi:hypothetical protein